MSRMLAGALLCAAAAMAQANDGARISLINDVRPNKPLKIEVLK